MIALAVYLNGKKLAVAVADDLCALNAIVNAVGELGRLTTPIGKRGKPDLWLSLSGLTSRPDGTEDEHLRWIGHRRLRVGDKITVQLVQTERPDRHRSSTVATRNTRVAKRGIAVSLLDRSAEEFAQMNRRRLAMSLSQWTVAAVAAVCPFAGANAATPPSLCEQLVTSMRASPTTVLKDAITAPSSGLPPWVVPAEPQPAEAEEVYKHIEPIWRKRLGPWPDKTIQTLPGTDLYMARTIAGSGDCVQYMFIEWKRGGMPRVLDDPRIGVGACTRLGSWGGLATVLGRPVYMESASLDPSSIDSLLGIAPWSGGKWGQPCRVSIRYTYQSSATQQYCGGTQALCAAAREAAASVERPYHAWSESFASWFNESPSLPAPKFHYGAALSPRERALVARAQRLGIPEAVDSGSGANPEWLQDLNRAEAYYFPLQLKGQLYVAAVAQKVYPSSGSLFFLFQAPRPGSQRLVPLAVFTMHWGATGVKLIQARD